MPGHAVQRIEAQRTIEIVGLEIPTVSRRVSEMVTMGRQCAPRVDEDKPLLNILSAFWLTKPRRPG